MRSFRRNNSGKVLVDKHTRKQFCMRVVYISLGTIEIPREDEDNAYATQI